PRIDMLVEAMNIILQNSFFEFDHKLYHQKEGAAMGSNVSPCYANIFVWDKEKQIVDREKGKGLLSLYKRLLDDILVMMKSTQKEFNDFLDKLKSMHKKLILKVETSEIQINFLDVTAYKGDRYKTMGVIDTKPYEKPGNLYLYVPYFSHHPQSNKTGWITAELLRHV